MDFYNYNDEKTFREFITDKPLIKLKTIIDSGNIKNNKFIPIIYVTYDDHKKYSKLFYPYLYYIYTLELQIYQTSEQTQKDNLIMFNMMSNFFNDDDMFDSREKYEEFYKDVKKLLLLSDVYFFLDWSKLNSVTQSPRHDLQERLIWAIISSYNEPKKKNQPLLNLFYKTYNLLNSDYKEKVGLGKILETDEITEMIKKNKQRELEESIKFSEELKNTIEEARKRKIEEEEARKRKIEEEDRERKMEEEARKRKMEEEARKRKIEEARKRKIEEEEDRKLMPFLTKHEIINADILKDWLKTNRGRRVGEVFVG